MVLPFVLAHKCPSLNSSSPFCVLQVSACSSGLMPEQVILMNWGYSPVFNSLATLSVNTTHSSNFQFLCVYSCFFELVVSGVVGITIVKTRAPPTRTKSAEEHLMNQGQGQRTSCSSGWKVLQYFWSSPFSDQNLIPIPGYSTVLGLTCQSGLGYCNCRSFAFIVATSKRPSTPVAAGILAFEVNQVSTYLLVTSRYFLGSHQLTSSLTRVKIALSGWLVALSKARRRSWYSSLK